MMTKWDSIQEDIKPIEPKFWGDELDEEETDELLELLDERDEKEIEKYLTLDWEE